MLRVRTGYSFRRAAGEPSEVIARIQKLGSKVAPITDTASAYGWVVWDDLCSKAGLRPVFGVELGVVPILEGKSTGRQPDFWLFIPHDELAPVNELIRVATMQARYNPILTIEQAYKAAESCTVIVGHKAQLNEEEWRNRPANMYMGVSPAMSIGHLNRARKHKWPLAATSDNRYPEAADKDFYRTLTGRNADNQLWPQHLLDDKEWAGACSHLDLTPAERKKAIANSAEILEGSRAGLRRAELPNVPKPQTLEQMCMAGAKKLGVPLKSKVYKERLTYELKLIQDKQFEDYFYIVADLCQWARKQMMVGPARGSSCGSLVCYLLEITTVDPIVHRLIFERFIDINRDDLPDIDIDFSKTHRPLVLDYLKDKYGGDRVAKLGAVSTYMPKSAIKEVGAALKVPMFLTSKVGDSLIQRSSGDSRALNSLEDTLMTTPIGRELLEKYPEFKIAARFEGHPKHATVHAAGIVIASKPINTFIGIDGKTHAAQCDKVDAERLNLLKIDALGLTQLSVFEDCLAAAGLPRTFLEHIPLDDPAAFEVLNKRHFAGVFQFNGSALQGLCEQFRMTEFEDVVAVTALARPGPLASGGAHEWVRRKSGKTPISYAHPIFKPYLEVTKGIVVYQEQTLEIGRLCGLTWGDVTKLRKAMSKSLGKEYFDQFGDPWKKGAKALGVPDEVANVFWDQLCAFGSWAFNRSHAVAYGMISYQCAYLKAHHPHEFAAATLSYEEDPASQIMILRELANEGIDYIPVDADLSTDKWTVRTLDDGRRQLVGPLSTVIGIGPKTIIEILHRRRLGQPISDRAHKVIARARTRISSLYPIRDAFAKILPDPKLRGIKTAPTRVCDIESRPTEQEFVVFVTPTKINPRDENEDINVSKRGGKRIEEDAFGTQSLNIHLADDTGEIFGKVGRKNFKRLAPELIERGRARNALYAIKGKLFAQRTPDDTFRMFWIENVRYIGDMTDAWGDASPVIEKKEEEVADAKN